MPSVQQDNKKLFNSEQTSPKNLNKKYQRSHSANRRVETASNLSGGELKNVAGTFECTIT
jgi:hypothetical protein